ncbi:glycosyltransferase family 2 protein [Sphingobium sp. AP50]|uniref:glycosyltransferase family 2 protein n=1 Tax=Sphingobium sp. AP50 TaxID=1884369 RepID=UPI002108FBD3|nr:glycosyltransferase [Sphingobium sp. AP50]
MEASLMGVSVLTLVRNRSAHLAQLVEGLRRSDRKPDELIIVDMSDEPVIVGPTSFPVRIDRFETQGLPLAAARNRAASLANHDMLLFLDVDCIPMRDCITVLCQTLSSHDALLCADVRYLGPYDARGVWEETDLLAQGRSHPARLFPNQGVREEKNAGLFWSLAFALRRSTFETIGGFDDGFTGYGAEDTDFGFRAATCGLKLLFVGRAIACHQYHDSYEPPVQHVADIVRNAMRFRARWDRWPMEGWLDAFARIGLVAWEGERLELLRLPTHAEMEASRVEPTG